MSSRLLLDVILRGPGSVQVLPDGPTTSRIIVRTEDGDMDEVVESREALGFHIDPADEELFTTLVIETTRPDGGVEKRVTGRAVRIRVDTVPGRARSARPNPVAIHLRAATTEEALSQADPDGWVEPGEAWTAL